MPEMIKIEKVSKESMSKVIDESNAKMLKIIDDDLSAILPIIKQIDTKGAKQLEAAAEASKKHINQHSDILRERVELLAD